MRLLSYPIHRDMPVYGGGAGPTISETRSILRGDTSNSLSIVISNHTGTHIDCPYHFDQAGRKLTDYLPDFWYVDSVAFVELKRVPSDGELIDIGALALENQSWSGKEKAVIMRTGWCLKRGEQAYWRSPPGIGPKVADGMRHMFPELRFFGFDLISTSSWLHREIGRSVHREFLLNDHPILLVEDMDLRTTDVLPPRDLLFSPFFLQNADGAPVTVWTDVRL